MGAAEHSMASEEITIPPASSLPSARASVAAWSRIALDLPAPAPPLGAVVIGVLEGEGVGPQIVATALRLLPILEECSGIRFDVRFGGPIGRDAEHQCGQPLSNAVTRFCSEIFEQGGALLAGAGGGRFVYDMRREFDLFLKLTPIRPYPELVGAGRLRPDALDEVDILMVRDNASGIYQGSWTDEIVVDEGRLCRQTFEYKESEVLRVVEVGARLAAVRSGRMIVVHKESGVPSISRLWADITADVSRRHGIDWRMIDVDLACYSVIQHARELDVVVAPNMCGDILSDLGAVLMGSRGVSPAFSFTPEGCSIFQTNHGAAYDLAGQDVANPAGQIAALGLMLHECFGLETEAALIDHALRDAWAAGYRTLDVAEVGGAGGGVSDARVVGTREFGDRVAEALAVRVGARNES